MTHPAIKKLLLGITGGIAAYKAAELVRLLVKQGIDVQVVMTTSACQFITPVTLQALSGKPVFTDMWDASIANGMPHIELSRNVDAILIAPASADFLSKLVHGGADDLLSTLCLARDCPLMVAPAMNKQMWENPATQRNIQQLENDDITIFGPGAGEQACGEIGLGRMLEPEQLVKLLSNTLQPKLFAGKHILITAGPTIEAIDPVRGITNFSSGKMGYSIAEVAQAMGAKVTLISGPTALQKPYSTDFIAITSAQEMHGAVMDNIAEQDIFISVAAVADYRPATASAHKLKKTEQAFTLELIPNTDILSEVANLKQPPFCVGFAAESEHLLEFAEQKRQRKKLPLIAANIATEAMGKDNSTLVLLDDNGSHTLPHATKSELARMLLQHIASMLSLHS
ncbi:phosphopantothenate synthase [Methylovorus sp. MM2]|uniref:bifunctional phosphopantothenoylcysteine decarboxylase/phosphopantothenate--cysteine ligase CoaBC n=1 Tax=Methylovorus sp. MM2 TaxID=1848038 RepID=UPI0007E1ED86|nr:bifunctional phosphopantothenoylcysteine decarboxylase/phosphopantothenate--cysteine ligase CoaBC [Methylovorus sp. MM2]OAM51662.1 phosphopantothenate synthase [Methylovorus sp. MM2]